MTDPMPDRCPAIEPGYGVLERCEFHVGHGGYHMAGGAWPAEVYEVRRCTAAGAITGGRCVLPGGHDEDEGTAHLFAGLSAPQPADEMASGPVEPPEPWRLDVPSVPEHVTALEDPDGVLWIRGLMGLRWHQWTKWSSDPQAWQDAEWIDVYTLLTRAPLVEHPDPRLVT